ncbi:LOW QUALITY PROTEIN: uncharacterized protein LOC135112989 [Scylla paramamosain]|uniref:LOW QUALITY PROTEIN: uncharacterized protein LOC135112989 n=1 Tax=Scylla paramamosain TaxID=85552 RepID=UPI003083DB0F
MVKYEDETYSFRLVAAAEDGRGTLSDCGSTVSSKQRIDSLFRDRRPRHALAPTPPLHPVRAELERMFGGRDQRQRAFQDVRATVQAQIERLFADASSEPLLPRKDKAPLPQLSAAAPARAPPPAAPPGPDVTRRHCGRPSLALPHSLTLPLPHPHRHRPPPRLPIRRPLPCTTRPPRGATLPPLPCLLSYAVDYLGAAVVDGRASSLGALQEPLRDLYYQYRAAVARGEARPGAGHLHITAEGLAVTREDGRRLLANPFPTIAVWAAVKLVTRRTQGGAAPVTHPYHYAFLPLISDPEAQDKGELFHPLRVPQPTLLASRAHHPPMLACVMRRVGVPRLLECHAFVCRSAEDAIVIAANLYQALLRGMGGSSPPSRPPSDPPSDTYSDMPQDDSRAVFSDSEAVPVRPPRRKRASRASRRGAPSGSLRRATSEDMLGGGRYQRASQRASQRRLRRSGQRARWAGRGCRRRGGQRGRVHQGGAATLPLLHEVSDKYCLTELVPESARGKAADEVLRQVVTPRGMSFSEMEPGQREALLSLALTMSRDEMYQRSKTSLRQQTRGSSSGGGGTLSEGEWSSSTLGSVLKATKTLPSHAWAHAPPRCSPPYLRDKKLPLRRLMVPAKGRHAPSQGRFAQRRPQDAHARRGTSRSGGDQSCSECGYDSECSSKCYCSLPRRGAPTGKGANDSGGSGGCRSVGGNSSGGPQLTCECDTESCAESEKCYCSLRRVRHDGLRLYAIDLDSEDGRGQRGGAPPAATTRRPACATVGVTPAPLPGAPRRAPPRRTATLPSSGRSTDSETPRRAPPPPLISPRRRRRHLSGSLGSRGSRGSIQGVIAGGLRRGRPSKILLVSAVDPSGRVVYRGASQRQQHHRQEGDTASILSMKKTAEIAALFSELKLSQTTDLLQPDHHHHHHHLHRQDARRDHDQDSDDHHNDDDDLLHHGR